MSVQYASDVEVPTCDELVARAKEIAKVLKERSYQANESRNVSDETVRAMSEAGLFRILQPKRWNGFEMHPNTFFKVQMALAEACMSTAWIYGVIGVHPYQLALFDDRAQQEVWGDDDSVLVSSTYQPVAKIKLVEGGYRISGRWSFSSGCTHCDWVLLGGMIPPDLSEAGAPDMRTFLLPRSDYQIIENWDVLGLRATGSNDILVEDVFVPEYRTHKALDGFLCQSPGNDVNKAPLYRIPWAQLFVRSVSTGAIGAAEGALSEYLKIAAKRMPSFSEKGTVHDPIAQTIVADAVVAINELKQTLFCNMNDLYDAAHEDRMLSIDDRVKYRYDSAVVVDRCLEIVTKLQHNLGGRGIYMNNPVARYFLDLNAARAHVANTPSKFAYNLGAVRLGLDNQDFFI
ncbi:acyl-CoA dehydrogenase family protein [Zhongshania borealis]